MIQGFRDCIFLNFEMVKDILEVSVLSMQCGEAHYLMPYILETCPLVLNSIG